jgi:hypothetical protein
MQIRELERELKAIELTETDVEVARRREHVLAATRDLVDFAQRRGRPPSGNMKLSIIPTLGNGDFTQPGNLSPLMTPEQNDQPESVSWQKRRLWKSLLS